MNLYNKQIIHRHLKNAVYQLKQPQLEKRVIILNDLKNIADEYPEFYSNIIQIITEFIKRNRSFKLLNNCQQNYISEINIDIQTALKIITNPDIDEYLRRVIVDLSYIEAIWYLFLKYKGFRKADLRSPATIRVQENEKS
ncbi:MAG: hypothetical protein MJK14_22755 [Rivularia sp. ALOHA_DT_140]|nr:hypothetical protein [Rivularia sp. ALOHA_DT_140]